MSRILWRISKRYYATTHHKHYEMHSIILILVFFNVAQFAHRRPMDLNGCGIRDKNSIVRKLLRAYFVLVFYAMKKKVSFARTLTSHNYKWYELFINVHKLQVKFIKLHSTPFIIRLCQCRNRFRWMRVTAHAHRQLRSINDINYLYTLPWDEHTNKQQTTTTNNKIRKYYA